MSGVLPNPPDGGLPPGSATVQFGYQPPVTFTVGGGSLLYYPSDPCSARWNPAMENAQSSELICLAAALNPSGTWNLSANCNLGMAFTAWATGTGPGTLGDLAATAAASAATVDVTDTFGVHLYHAFP